jgi:hypothetical protein
MTQADAAGTWKLGGDLEVPRMGFGAMQLGGRNAFGRADDPEQSRRALRTPRSSSVSGTSTPATTTGRTW